MEKWSIDQGNLMSVTARKHRLGLYWRSKDRQLLRNISKESVITNSKQLKPKKSADSFKEKDGNRNWNFVKLMNEVLQRWKNYGNSEFCLRYYSEKKTHRGSEHYLGTLWQSTGIAK